MLGGLESPGPWAPCASESVHRSCGQWPLIHFSPVVRAPWRVCPSRRAHSRVFECVVVGTLCHLRPEALLERGHSSAFHCAPWSGGHPVGTGAGTTGPATLLGRVPVLGRCSGWGMAHGGGKQATRQARGHSSGVTLCPWVFSGFDGVRGPVQGRHCCCLLPVPGHVLRLDRHSPAPAGLLQGRAVGTPASGAGSSWRCCGE